MSDQSVPANVSKAAEFFRDSVAAQFELEADFLNVLGSLFIAAATPLTSTQTAGSSKKSRAASSSAAGASAEPKQKAKNNRKKSAYNVYVSEQMKTDSIKAINHKQKMSAIASSWNLLSEEQKKVYADQASGEHEAAVTAAE